MVVNAVDVSLDASVSLPVLAAKAQLGQVQTQTSLSIRGYAGRLRLPQFATLDVDNYGDFMKAVSTLQDLLTKSLDGVEPVLLARLAPDPTPSSIDVAAAAV